MFPAWIFFAIATLLLLALWICERMRRQRAEIDTLYFKGHLCYWQRKATFFESKLIAYEKAQKANQISQQKASGRGEGEKGDKEAA